MLITVSYRRCGRNLRAKLDTVINSLSANHAYLKTLYNNVETWVDGGVRCRRWCRVVCWRRPMSPSPDNPAESANRRTSCSCLCAARDLGLRCVELSPADLRVTSSTAAGYSPDVPRPITASFLHSVLCSHSTDE